MVKINLSSPKTLEIGLNPLILREKRLFARSPVTGHLILTYEIYKSN
jgi:hypothetical protein